MGHFIYILQYVDIKSQDKKTLEPRHEKNGLQFLTRVDSNWLAQLQKLASLEFLDIASRGIILSKQRTTKVLIRLRG